MAEKLPSGLISFVLGIVFVHACAHTAGRDASLANGRECFIIAPLHGSAEILVGGEDDCSQRTLPASTFKIPHALVALETGVLTGTAVEKWDGTPQDFKVWERDQTLDSAIKWSVVWFFQRAARSIGREREQQYLRAFRYGSQTFAGEVDRFWLTGDLTVSPREQIDFLQRMFSYDLPVTRKNVDTVKAAMTMPAGKLVNASGTHAFPLKWPADTLARMKTGNGTVSGDHVSWVIGQLERRGGQQYVFTSRVRSSDALGMTAAADLAVRVLNTKTP